MSAARSGFPVTVAAVVTAALVGAPVLLAASPASAMESHFSGGLGHLFLSPTSHHYPPHDPRFSTPEPRFLTEHELSTHVNPWAEPPLSRDAHRGAPKSPPPEPSWPQTRFSTTSDAALAPLTALFTAGRGARVEIRVPAKGETEPGEHYWIENLGGGRVRVTDPEGGTVAEGRLYDHWVQRWWAWLRALIRSVFKSGMLTQGRLGDGRVSRWLASLPPHLSWAHQPGTGGDLSQIGKAFPGQFTRLTASDSPMGSQGYDLSATDQKPRGVLLPRDVTPETPQALMFIRDQLLQDQPLDPQLLVGEVDLEQVYATRFRKTPVRKLANRAAVLGKGSSAARVLGIARDPRGENRDPGRGKLLTVAAADDGQLVLYDQAGDYYDTTEALLGDHTLNFLPTTGKTRIPRVPSNVTGLPTTTWTHLPKPKTAIKLVFTLAPTQAIDILRTHPSEKQISRAVPEIFRVTRLYGGFSYQPVQYSVTYDQGLLRKERTFTRPELLKFFDKISGRGILTAGKTYSHVFVRRAEKDTAVPDKNGSPWVEPTIWEQGLRGWEPGSYRKEPIDPFRYWTLAQPETASGGTPQPHAVHASNS